MTLSIPWTGRILLYLLVHAVCALSMVKAEEFSVSHVSDDIVDHWNAFRSLVDDNGVVLQTVNTLDVMTNVSGGRQQSSSFTGDLDLLLTVDADQWLGWKDATFLFYGLGLYGKNPSRDVGDVQAVSNIAAPSTWKLFEAWYQQNFWQERFSLLVGLYDVTSEFDVIRSASEMFLNSSFGTGGEFAASAGNSLSTFPTTSLSIRGQAIIADSLAIRAVIADGIPGNVNDPNGTEVILDEDDGLFANTEIAYYRYKKRTTKRGRNQVIEKRPFRLVFQRVGRAAPVEYEGKYALGVWAYSREFDDLRQVDRTGPPGKRQGTYGIYGLAEQIILRETQDRDQGLTIFARLGYADPRANRFSQYYGGGLVYTGLVSGRDRDEMGIGVAALLNGSHYMQAQQRVDQPVDKAEIALELTYAIKVAPAIIIQPDVQYIINPDTNPSVGDALVLGMRLGLNASWFESQ